jgi:hypothetical protein
VSASVVVAGALANKAGNGGEAWVRLSYVLGFRRLGCDVTFVEEIEQAQPAAVEFFRATTEAFGLTDSSALVDSAGASIVGARAPHADVLVNVSGNLRAEPILSGFRRTAYVDVDPGFTQIWHEDGTLEIPPHDVYFTIAENIGLSSCAIPSTGIEWRTARPPVVLDRWRVAPTDDRRFTTVATWRGPYGRVEHAGRIYSVKVDEFRKVIPLPRCSRQRFELALDIHSEEHPDLEALRENSWNLVDPRAVAADPHSFRRYVQGSGAEFSVAQGIYVETSSGWFSDRTTRYLASGKPALVQDTGFSRTIPTGEGLLTFSTLDEAVEGAEAIAADYDRHARAARAVAEEHFDSDRVLSKLLEDALP